MSQNCRKEVLKVFKSLHGTRKSVFDGDARALQMAREKINSEFKKNKNVTDITAIETLIQYTKDVEKELKTTVIQAKEIQPGKFQAVIKPDTVRLDNVPFSDCCTKQESVKNT